MTIDFTGAVKGTCPGCGRDAFLGIGPFRVACLDCQFPPGPVKAVVEPKPVRRPARNEKVAARLSQKAPAVVWRRGGIKREGS
jgi:hypothetical protein